MLPVMNPIRTILVDDHATFRGSLRKFVEMLGVIEVVGEAADGLQAQQLASELCPQFVLMDICMPQMNGTDACCAMKRDNPSLRVVLYSADALEIEVAVAQGLADFCLTKECLFDELPAWIGATFNASQGQTCPNTWQRLNRSFMTYWRQTITDFVASHRRSRLGLTLPQPNHPLSGQGLTYTSWRLNPL
jgi:DNA-binding NarL/FixJ family response regulator